MPSATLPKNVHVYVRAESIFFRFFYRTFLDPCFETVHTTFGCVRDHFLRPTGYITYRVTYTLEIVHRARRASTIPVDTKSSRPRRCACGSDKKARSRSARTHNGSIVCAVDFATDHGLARSGAHLTRQTAVVPHCSASPSSPPNLSLGRRERLGMIMTTHQP